MPKPKKLFVIVTVSPRGLKMRSEGSWPEAIAIKKMQELRTTIEILYGAGSGHKVKLVPDNSPERNPV